MVSLIFGAAALRPEVPGNRGVACSIDLDIVFANPDGIAIVQAWRALHANH